MKNIYAEDLWSAFSVSPSSGQRVLVLCFGILFAAFSAPDSLFAQQLSPSEMPPPPLKILSLPEKKMLDGETDVKKRTALALEMMNFRIQKAEECDSHNDFSQMYSELGGFHALMDYALNFLNRSNSSSSKNLGNFKKYEMGLRGFPSRIELLRRELPVKYEYYLSDLLKDIRDARSKAIEPFFSDTVVPNN